MQFFCPILERTISFSMEIVNIFYLFLSVTITPSLIAIQLHELTNKTKMRLVNPVRLSNIPLEIVIQVVVLLSSGDLPVFPLEKGHSLCRRSGHVQCFDMVGADGQWQAIDNKQEVPDCCSCCTVSKTMNSIHLWIPIPIVKSISYKLWSFSSCLHDIQCL